MSVYRGRNRREFALASALYDSVIDNDIKGLYVLLKKGADANMILQKTGISPFHLVIGNDSAEFALRTTKLILQHGGNPNICSDEGLTPLHIAAAWGRVEIVQLLLRCGADPEIRDTNYLLPIDYAIDYKHQEIASLLLKSMYNNFTFLNIQEEVDCEVNFDKIIINNGLIEAEYKAEMESDYLSHSSSECRLLELPQETSNEYVSKWCKTHARESLKELQSTVEISSRDTVLNKNDSHDSFNLSHETFNSSPLQFNFINCKPRQPNTNVIENFSLSYEYGKKYRSKSNSENGIPIQKSPTSFGKYIEGSRESGITTLSNVSSTANLKLSVEEHTSHVIEILQDTSSDYFTCNDDVSGSTGILDQNIFDDFSILNRRKCTQELSHIGTKLKIVDKISFPNGIVDVSNIESFLTSDNENKSDFNVAEVYKHVDIQDKVILLEKRFLVHPKGDETGSISSQTSSAISSKMSSLPTSFNYDSDNLRIELKRRGFNPGPVTKTTKRVYLKKLYKLQKLPICGYSPKIEEHARAYSKELETTLNNSKWPSQLADYKIFEDGICGEFNNPDPSRKWREGTNKSSFTYLLLDPRITKNLPKRAEYMSSNEIWKTFLSSIFYVGKGKRSRPYSHLYEAVTLWNENQKSANEKLQYILSIWKDNFGVVCLHVFQNVIPAEAYTREAAMLKALKIENVKNIRSGEFYGISSTWSSHEQKMLGVLLLHKAMLIFLNEGERQLRPFDIN